MDSHPKKDRLSRWLDYPFVFIGGIGLTVMMVATVASTLGNLFFDRPVPDIVTLDELLMVFVVFLPLAFVQLEKEHIEVTLATDWLKPRHKAYVRCFALVFTVIFFCMLTWALGSGAYQAWYRNDIYTGEFTVPSWPTRLLATIGCAGFVLRLLVDFLKEVSNIRNRQYGTE